MAKAYKDYTIADLRRLNLSFLVNCKEPSEADEMRKRFTHLVVTAGAVGIPIDHLTFERFAEQGSTTRIADELSLNKILFELKHRADTLLKTGGFNAEIIETNIKSIFKTITESGLNMSRLLRDRDSANSNVSAYYERYVQQLAKLKSINEQIHTLQLMSLGANNEGEQTLMDELKAVIANPFFQLQKWDNEHSLFVFTTKPVVMQYVEPAAGINESVNLGAYIVLLKFSDGTPEFKVNRYKSNLLSEGYYHPFVSTSGSVCFGNVSEDVAKLLFNKKYAQAFEYLQTLLTTYAASTPYYDLFNLKTKGVRRSISGCDSYTYPYDELLIPSDTDYSINDMVICLIKGGGNTPVLGTIIDKQSSGRYIVKGFAYIVTSNNEFKVSMANMSYVSYDFDELRLLNETNAAELGMLTAIKPLFDLFKASSFLEYASNIYRLNRTSLVPRLFYKSFNEDTNSTNMILYSGIINLHDIGNSLFIGYMSYQGTTFRFSRVFTENDVVIPDNINEECKGYAISFDESDEYTVGLQPIHEDDCDLDYDDYDLDDEIEEINL